LPAAGSAALAERGSCPGASVRPVKLDDLHGKLPRGEEVGRGAVAGGVLEAEVEEGEEDGVLVRGGEVALVEELEDALGERKRGVGVGIDEQQGILAGGTDELSSPRAGGVRCGGHVGSRDDVDVDDVVACSFASPHTAGRRTRNTLPAPGVESTHTCPPCASTIRFTIA